MITLKIITKIISNRLQSKIYSIFNVSVSFNPKFGHFGLWAGVSYGPAATRRTIPGNHMKHTHRLLPALAALAALTAPTPAAEPELPARTALPPVLLPVPKLVARVETARMDFKPGQRMPAHRHPVPVICFVTEGNLVVRIGDEPEKKAVKGTVTFEPAGVITHYFRNASSSEPAQIACANLAGAGDSTQRIMVDEKAK
jgi:quercetin dioxygenase-like cupin family protein